MGDSGTSFVVGGGRGPCWRM